MRKCHFQAFEFFMMCVFSLGCDQPSSEQHARFLLRTGLAGIRASVFGLVCWNEWLFVNFTISYVKANL